MASISTFAERPSFDSAPPPHHHHHHQLLTAPAPDPDTMSKQRLSQAARRKRLRWTPALHVTFVDSVLALGGGNRATPKEILRHMLSEGTGHGLTVDHIKSHLQKYRMCIKLGDMGDACSSGNESGETEPGPGDALCRLHDELLRHEHEQQLVKQQKAEQQDINDRAAAPTTACSPSSGGNANDSAVSTEAEHFHRSSNNRPQWSAEKMEHAWYGGKVEDMPTATLTLPLPGPASFYPHQPQALHLVWIDGLATAAVAAEACPPLDTRSRCSRPSSRSHSPPPSSQAHAEALRQALSTHTQLEAALRDQMSVQVELQSRLKQHGHFIEKLVAKNSTRPSAPAAPSQLQQQQQQEQEQQEQQRAEAAVQRMAHDRLLLNHQHQHLPDKQALQRLNEQQQQQQQQQQQFHLQQQQHLYRQQLAERDSVLLSSSRCSSDDHPPAAAPAASLRCPLPHPASKAAPPALDLRLGLREHGPATASYKRPSPEPSFHPASLDLRTSNPHPSAPQPSQPTPDSAGPKRMRHTSSDYMLPPGATTLDLTAGTQLTLHNNIQPAYQVHQPAPVCYAQVEGGTGSIACFSSNMQSMQSMQLHHPMQAMQPMHAMQSMQPMQAMRYIAVPGPGGTQTLLAVVSASAPMMLQHGLVLQPQAAPGQGQLHIEAA